MADPVENEPRIRYNGLRNLIPGALSAGVTSVTFASKLTHVGGDVPTLTLGNGHFPLHVIDPATGMLREIIRVTAYTTGSTTATIVRLAENYGGGNHPAGCGVVCGIGTWDLGYPQTWQPVAWTASTTNPVLGNGTAVGYYSLHGPLCSVTYVIQGGSTTTYGAGSWTFALPVATTQIARFHASVRFGGNPYFILSEANAGATVLNVRFPPSVAGDPWAAMGPGNPEASSSSNIPLLRINGTYMWC